MRFDPITVTTISALPGTPGEKILLEIIKQGDFREWKWISESECYITEGLVYNNGTATAITLKNGIIEGLFLEKKINNDTFSLKPLDPPQKSSIICIPIGEHIPEERIEAAAQAIIKVWVFHGYKNKKRRKKTKKTPLKWECRPPWAIV